MVCLEGTACKLMCQDGRTFSRNQSGSFGKLRQISKRAPSSDLADKFEKKHEYQAAHARNRQDRTTEDQVIVAGSKKSVEGKQ